MKFPSWPNQIGYRNIELGLDRMYKILERLNNPHKKLPPTIHIAGTNGKGSTLSFLRSILEHHDQKVHCYTSPHLVEFNERIVISGENISDNFLNECLEICKKACEAEPKITPTYFEGITAAAFLAFSKVKADFLILETGLGGRLDATNVIEDHLFSIITPISKDHTEFLGEKISQIAFEKAGIMKKNCPVFIAKQDPEALKVLKDKAKELNCQTTIFQEDFDINIKENGWEITELTPEKWRRNNGWLKKPPKKLLQSLFQSLLQKPLQSSPQKPPQNLPQSLPFTKFLAGSHQLDNACIALYSIITQNLIAVKENRIKSAILNTKWPARLQNIDSGAIFDKINAIFNEESQNFELFLDGSHNESGAETIKNLLKNYENRQKIIVFSMLKDKDCHSFLKQIKNEADILIAKPIKNEKNSLKNEEITKICEELNIKSAKSSNINDAIAKIKEFANKDSIIIFCGSLYSAGEFLEENLDNKV